MAFLALITTPIVIGVINSAKEQANRRSVDGLVRAGTYYLSESLLDQEKAEKIKNQENLINEISYEGKEPESGQLYVNEKSDVALAVKYGDKCYKKEYTGHIETLEYNNINCKLNINIKQPEVTIVVDNVFNNQGWANSNFTVTINATDYSGLGVNIKWCGSSNQSCDPTTLVTKDKLVLPISQETSGSKICAKAIDGFLNESEVSCSEYYKLDKIAPTFLGLTDIEISQNDALDLESGVMLNDSLSGIEGTFTYSPTDVDKTKAGVYTITYTGKDLAGNIGTGSRKVIVHTAAPSITFIPESNKINSNGWSKEKMYVTINAIDYSSYGIEKLVWCGTTGSSCTPTTEVKATSASALISTESSTNKICAYAVDKYGQTGETSCSSVYKLDKTIPTAGTLNINGTLGSNGWYTSNVTLSVNNGSDTLSGHATTTTSHTSITTNTTGTTVTITTSDLAGNTATRTYTIKVDKNAPTLTAKSGNVSINQGSNNAVSSYFNTPIYSISGGSLSCNPTNTNGLAIGTRTVSCTAIGNNGLTNTQTVTVTVKTISPSFYVAYYSSVAKYTYKNNDWVKESDVYVGSGANPSISAINGNSFYYVSNGNMWKYVYKNNNWEVESSVNLGSASKPVISAIDGNSFYYANDNSLYKYVYRNNNWEVESSVYIGSSSNHSISTINGSSFYHTSNGNMWKYVYRNNNWEVESSVYLGATSLRISAINSTSFYYTQGNSVHKYSYRNNNWELENNVYATINGITVNAINNTSFYFVTNNSVLKYIYQNNNWELENSVYITAALDDFSIIK